MAKLLKKITLVCSAVGEKNNNKVWIGELYDNDMVITRWGRIGAKMDFKEFPNVGESFLLKKEKEKLRPKKDKESYTRAHVLDDVSTPTGSTSPVSNSSLASIAHEQLAKNNPELSKLIDRLVKANIHNITSQTNITYNSSTGLFQTPIGIITKVGIDEARAMLVDIKKTMLGKGKGEMSKLVSNYLRIIPQKVGSRLTVESVFPNTDAIEKQSDILDSLEASLKSVTTAPPKTDGTPAPVEKVFEVELSVLKDPKEIARLEDFYRKSMKSMHGYGHVKIQNFYVLDIKDMSKNYATKLGNHVEVYHGTSQANLLSIFKSGLKTSPPSSAYIAGKMFGNGIYGAINSSKSLGYTFGRWGGSQGDSGWLIVCDFAMGKVHEPHGTCSGPASGCDSVWAKTGKTSLYHDELIVYKNNQVKTKYLLECK